MLCGVVAVGGRIVLGGGGLLWEGEAPAKPADAIWFVWLFASAGNDGRGITRNNAEISACCVVLSPLAVVASWEVEVSLGGRGSCRAGGRYLVCVVVRIGGKRWPRNDAE